MTHWVWKKIIIVDFDIHNPLINNIRWSTPKTNGENAEKLVKKRDSAACRIMNVATILENVPTVDSNY